MTIQQHDKMKIHMRGYLIGRGYYTAYKAMNLMMGAFRNFRKDGITPVWSHPLYIASVIRTLPLGEHEEAVLSTAFLHDYFEDLPDMSWKLEESFDKDLLHYARILDKNCCKLTLLSDGKKAQNEMYYASILKHPYTVIVKAVDRYHNLKTMVGVFSDEKIEEYIVETEEFVLPMLKQGMRLHPEFEAILQNIKLGINTQLGLFRSFQTALSAKDAEIEKQATKIRNLKALLSEKNDNLSKHSVALRNAYKTLSTCDNRIAELESAGRKPNTTRPPLTPPFTVGRDLANELIATCKSAPNLIATTKS